MEIIIDGGLLKTEADLHEVLAAEIGFGPYYGRNLAALRDRLSSDVERPIRIVLRNSDLCRRQLGDELFDKIIAIFRFVEEQDISFGWDERFNYALE